ncbi:hypothetical protein ACIQU5_13775 [Streptomyces sp. NPDC090306]|uniref:hypothetical protein n=1 Tax=Streptomyces sp. NPDC090306 TaxID=3365961 RepID=UPI00381415C1
MTARPDGHEEVRARLRGAAGAHHPDRARMLARVERGMARPPRERAGPRPRPVLAGWAGVAATVAAVAGVLAAGGYAVTSAVRDPAPAGRTAAASAVPAPAAPSPPRARASGAPHAGPLRSAGAVDSHSNAYWAQSDLTVTVSARLTSFSVRLDVALTAGVKSTGAWLTLPEDDFTRTVTEADGFLRYEWVLRPGRTVPPGEWVFAAQYDHAQGSRDAGDDTYTATGTAEDGQRGAVTGHFTAGTANSR